MGAIVHERSVGQGKKRSINVGAPLEKGIRYDCLSNLDSRSEVEVENPGQFVDAFLTKGLELF